VFLLVADVGVGQGSRHRWDNSTSQPFSFSRTVSRIGEVGGGSLRRSCAL
jgi:hypothetical protein